MQGRVTLMLAALAAALLGPCDSFIALCPRGAAARNAWASRVRVTRRHTASPPPRPRQPMDYRRSETRMLTKYVAGTSSAAAAERLI